MAQGTAMTKKLYVGNLAFATTSDDLRDAFSQFGTVTSATVITDRETGRSRGFGFVEMDDEGLWISYPADCSGSK